ncbi:diphosphomevalonate decarboxylase [Rickettsiaceae bacterium]|nr:diphosphomevalonate decarboxylase [Rickettsiaceae bacterium]
MKNSIILSYLFLLIVTQFTFTSEVLASESKKFTKEGIIKSILPSDYRDRNIKSKGIGKAPVNIALTKYWGKRNKTLNLPFNSSLSIALPFYSTTIVSLVQDKDLIFLNGKETSSDSSFAKRTREFLNLFRRDDKMFFRVETTNDLPTASGFASSASGLAALVLSLNDLFDWQLESKQLSILARLGSGSAARSLYSGFVEWSAGTRKDGLDSYGLKLQIKEWKDLRLGVIVVSDEQKEVSSRDGMSLAVRTSPFYKEWVNKANQDIQLIKDYIAIHDFANLGKVMESNALAMHATAITSTPPLLYWSPETISIMHKVWQLRNQNGISVYFTMDAGASPFLFFEKNDTEIIEKTFPNIKIVKPLF